MNNKIIRISRRRNAAAIMGGWGSPRRAAGNRIAMCSGFFECKVVSPTAYLYWYFSISPNNSEAICTEYCRGDSVKNYAIASGGFNAPPSIRAIRAKRRCAKKTSYHILPRDKHVFNYYLCRCEAAEWMFIWQKAVSRITNRLEKKNARGKFRLQRKTETTTRTTNGNQLKKRMNRGEATMAKAGMRRPDPKEPHGTESNHKNSYPKNSDPPVPEIQGKAKHKEKANPIRPD